MRRRFEELRETIESLRDEPVRVKYIMLGRIMQAMEDDALTIKEAWKLESMLGLQETPDYDYYREVALMGLPPVSAAASRPE